MPTVNDSLDPTRLRADLDHLQGALNSALAKEADLARERGSRLVALRRDQTRAEEIDEARLSAREWRGERMEASVPGEARALFPLHDDGRDLRDDVRDRDNTLARYEEMARVGTMSTALQNDVDRGRRAAMKRNLELAESFLALMRRDLAAEGQEGATAIEILRIGARVAGLVDDASRRERHALGARHADLAFGDH